MTGEASSFAHPSLGWRRRLIDPVAPAVSSAALMFLSGGIACLTAVAFPLIATEHLDLVLFVGVLSFAFAGFVCVWGKRIAWTFALLSATGSLLVSLIVATCSTGGAVKTVALAYLGMAVYYGYAFNLPMVCLQWLLFASSFGFALLIDGVPNMTAYWATLSIVVLAIALGLNHQTDDLRRLADTDWLTGLLNHRGFSAAATREHEMARRTRQPLAAVVMDIDGFKQINDTKGHLAGNRLLVELSQSWKAELRPGDILARVGGDEFVLLMPSTLQQSAEREVERLLRRAAARVEGMPVTLTYGASRWTQGETLDSCLQRADEALYEKKRRKGLRENFAQ